MQAPHPTVLPIFQTRHFLVNLLSTVFLTGVINFFIDRAAASKVGAEHALVVSEAATTGVIVSNIIFVILILPGSGAIRKQILTGALRPVRASALRSGLWAVLPHVAITTWYVRAAWFVTFAVIGPSLATILTTRVACQIFLAEDPTCDVGLDLFVAWSVTWKVMCVVVIMVCNYAAAHNVDQAELKAKTV